MTLRTVAIAAAAAFVAFGAQAQEEAVEAVEEVVEEVVETVASAAGETAADILGKPKLLPATAKLPDGACNDGLYQEAALFLVLPSEAPGVGDVLTLSDYVDPRSGESVAEAKGFRIVKSKSDFELGEDRAMRTAYTYYLAFNKMRDCQ